jgi:hypothetical protein
MLIFTVPFKFDTNPGSLWGEINAIMALDFGHEGRDQGEGDRSDGIMMSFFSQEVSVKHGFSWPHPCNIGLLM